VKILQTAVHESGWKWCAVALIAAALLALPNSAQQVAPRDPAEPLRGKPQPKLLPRPAGAISRQLVDEKSMRALIHQVVACGTRLTISSWTDPKRGVGCGRDQVVVRLNEIAKDSGGRLQVVVDKFEAMSKRTGGNPVPMENVYAILPGSDPKFAKTVFIVSGHMDSRPSDEMDPKLNAPGADDDASGTAVSVECARLLTKLAASGHATFRATLLFAVVSGEEQGLLGSTHLVEWLKQQGYTVGGMLDDDIVGADRAPGGPRRVRVFSGNGGLMIAIRLRENWPARLKRLTAAGQSAWSFAWIVLAEAATTILFTRRTSRWCASPNRWKSIASSTRRRARRMVWSTEIWKNTWIFGSWETSPATMPRCCGNWRCPRRLQPRPRLQAQ
jgi:hypothetical protein